MIRISLPYVFNLAPQLEPLSALPDKNDIPYGDVFLPIISAEGALSQLLQSLYAPYLRSSNPLGHTLLGLLQAQTKQKDFDRKIGQFELWQIKSAYSQYRTVLIAEFNSLDAYFVTQKGPYDSMVLLAFGEALFPTDLTNKVPEAVFDCREAGRCLAYELPTAAGFHAFRATESVLRRYYAQVTGGAAAPKVRTIGVYVKALQFAKKGDTALLAALSQLCSLHRNPLIHPEAVLTIDEAISILGMTRSVVTGMLAALPVRPPTTAVAAASTPSSVSVSPSP